jgi:hypothetical protein
MLTCVWTIHWLTSVVSCMCTAGAISTYYTKLEVSDVTFTSCWSFVSGGAIFAEAATTLDITMCAFLDGGLTPRWSWLQANYQESQLRLQLREGSAIHATSSTVLIFLSTFEVSRANEEGTRGTTEWREWTRATTQSRAGQC